MKNFNAQYGKHSRLELLKHFILEHGTYIELKKGEQFSVQGKMNRRGAYIENGLLRYIHVDERGNIHMSRPFFFILPYFAISRNQCSIT